MKGERDLKCSPWGGPNYNPQGWKGPVLPDHATAITRPSTSSMTQTDWDKYENKRDPRCANCMMHSGFEHTVVPRGGQEPERFLGDAALEPRVADGALHESSSPCARSRMHVAAQASALDARAPDAASDALLARQDPKPASGSATWRRTPPSRRSTSLPRPLAGTPRRHLPGRPGRRATSLSLRETRGRRLAHLRERAGHHQRHGQGLLRPEDGGACPRRTPRSARARRLRARPGQGSPRSASSRGFLLALFGEMDWKGVPCMPVELMLLPRWFYFNLYEISYWSRTVLVPLLIIFAHRPVRPAPAHARSGRTVPRPTGRGGPIVRPRCRRRSRGGTSSSSWIAALQHPRPPGPPAVPAAGASAPDRALDAGADAGQTAAWAASSRPRANAVIALTCRGYRLDSPEGVKKAWPPSRACASTGPRRFASSPACRPSGTLP
ncbi:MAG: DUF3463 domain-containing protein [Candidatus Moduliflexus flocculans]|nr:DUF3463 domain-containing protein [Candidatus Moduliflexus flocculans]